MLQLVASKAGKTAAAENAKIHVAVHLGTPQDREGFALGVDIKVEGVEDESLIEAAHEVRELQYWLSVLLITVLS